MDQDTQVEAPQNETAAAVRNLHRFLVRIVAVVVIAGGLFGYSHWQSNEKKKQKEYACNLQQASDAQHPGERQLANSLIDRMETNGGSADPNACR